MTAGKSRRAVEKAVTKFCQPEEGRFEHRRKRKQKGSFVFQCGAGGQTRKRKKTWWKGESEDNGKGKCRIRKSLRECERNYAKRMLGVTDRQCSWQSQVTVASPLQPPDQGHLQRSKRTHNEPRPQQSDCDKGVHVPTCTRRLMSFCRESVRLLCLPARKILPAVSLSRERECLR